MELSAALFGMAVALTLGAMSPGPSFILVARTAVAVSRRDGLAAALGMGVGGVGFAVLALLGLLAVLAAVPWLYGLLKVVGGCYLLHLGWRIWRGARQPLVLAGTEPHARPLGRSFLQGLLTQLSNPKTAVVYASVFASLLPAEPPPSVWVVLPVLVFAIESGWYALVALALSAPRPRARYLAAKAGIDRAAGTLLALLGLKLVLDAPQS